MTNKLTKITKIAEKKEKKHKEHMYRDQPAHGFIILTSKFQAPFGNT